MPQNKNQINLDNFVKVKIVDIKNTSFDVEFLQSGVFKDWKDNSNGYICIKNHSKNYVNEYFDFSKLEEFNDTFISILNPQIGLEGYLINYNNKSYFIIVK